MSAANDGGPAFPEVRIEQRGDSRYVQPSKVLVPGMSLRDWFAGQIAAAIMVKGARAGLKEIASDAYDIADAMLAERAKPKP